MRDLLLEKVADAAEGLGLERGRVMTKSLRDNLTLPRPRIELDFLPETYRDSGRLQGGAKKKDPASGSARPRYRKQLYEVTLQAAAQILADDPAWVKDFAPKLVAALPRGFDDKNGNYVWLRAAEGRWEGFEARRVGEAVIDPIVKRGYLLHLTAVWRASQELALEFVERVAFDVVKPVDKREEGEARHG